jgi:DNA-directed RNA polymerase subunit RPC12/RpoP
MKYPVYACKRCGKEYAYVKEYADKLSAKPTNICGQCLERKKNARRVRRG